MTTTHRTGDPSLADRAPDGARTAGWIALVTVSSIVFSMVLACATPFAALAAFAGVATWRRTGLMLIGVAWLANQAVGYLALGYPQTWDSFAWGAAIGIAAVLATLAASVATRMPLPRFGRILVGFVFGFLAFELTLFAATAILPSGDEAFSLAIVARVFAVNGLALAGLLVLQRTAEAVGLGPRPRLSRFAVTEA
jgi:hypothetical protein